MLQTGRTVVWFLGYSDRKNVMEILIEFLMFMGDRFNKCRLKTGGRDKSEWCGKGYKSAGDWVDIGR